MSFAEKIAGLLSRPNQQQDPIGDDQPWYVKYGVKLLGIVGGFFCILFGLFNAVGILLLQVSCLIGGVLEILVGFLVLVLEAPACFICGNFAEQLTSKLEGRPMWYRAALYCIIAIPPVIICPGLGSIFPCVLVFATGAMYGMMSLGKKAPADQMRQAAVNSGYGGGSNTTSDRAGIVNNAQPFSFTGAVGTDSNV